MKVMHYSGLVVLQLLHSQNAYNMVPAGDQYFVLLQAESKYISN